MPPPRDPGSCAGSACGARSKAGFFAKGACPQPAREACEGKSACAGFAQEGRALHRSFPFRGFGTLPNKPFSTDAPQRGRAKIRKWVPASYACYECFYPLGSYPLLRRKSDFAKLPQKKNAAISKKITTLSKSCSVLSRTFLFALFFDFGNLFCRCGHNPYACIAHTVKERVKLPPLCVLCSGRV